MTTFSFLLKVAKEYSIPFDELRKCVLDVFTYEQLKNLDPDREYFGDTEHFNCFVREHDLKKVNIGTVVLYLKGVKLVVSNSNLSFDLEDSNERQNQKMRLIKGVFIITSLALAGLSIFV